jgi:hypothetical protein
MPWLWYRRWYGWGSYLVIGLIVAYFSGNITASGQETALVKAIFAILLWPFILPFLIVNLFHFNTTLILPS